MAEHVPGCVRQPRPWFRTDSGVSMAYDEARRRRTLQAHHDLDTEREPDLNNIADLASMALGLPICIISLTASERHWFKSSYKLDATDILQQMSVGGVTFPNSGELILADVADDPRFANAAFVSAPPGLRFYGAIPLIDRSGHRIGILSVLDVQPRHDFTGSKLAILRKLAATATELLEARSRNLELVRCSVELAHLARHDPLTGLENRRAMDDYSLRGVADVSQGVDWALLYLDLDHFKTINDTFGHRAGDELLREAAGRLRTCVRRGDQIVRLGGDEFAILLCGRDSGDYATQLAHRLIDAVAAPYLLNGHTVRISVSIGVAVALGHLGPSPPLADLLRNADVALYQAKKDGRNRWSVSGGESPGVNGDECRRDVRSGVM